jgi:hypothetical protein
MNTVKLASAMKATIEEIKAKGTHAIPCENLIAYLKEVESTPDVEPSAVQMEQYKAHLQNWIEAQRQSHEARLEMFRSVITSGQNALRSAFLLNGGAAVAILAFVGHLAEVRPPQVPEFGPCLIPFAIGVLTVTITSGLSYLCQWFYAKEDQTQSKVGLRLNVVCIVLGFTSYACFLWGIVESYSRFMAYK